MPEPVLTVLFFVVLCVLFGMVLLDWDPIGALSRHRDRPDPLEESAAAHRAAITAAATARASAHAALTAELDAFDAAARRILDALDVPCVCSQVSTHEWDEHTQTYQQRWKVPEHFTACAKHWPATTETPPGAIAELQRERTSLTAAHLQRQGGPMLTPAARVDAERARYVVEAWARRAAALDRREDYDWYGGRYTPGGVRYRYPTTRGVPKGCTCVPGWAREFLHLEDVPHASDCRYNTGAGADQQRQGGPPLPHPERLTAAMRRPAGAATTYGVPADCTCVPAHAHAALANTHVVHRTGCATTRGPHAAEWRPMGDNG